MGYQAGAVYECIPFFKQVLEETPLNNLLVRACRIYLENEFVVAGLKALANFTYKVTMPYLNFIERSDQNALVGILPKLYDDLTRKKMNTLSEFHVEWSHVDMKENKSTSDLDHYLLEEMCLKAAVGVRFESTG